MSEFDFQGHISEMRGFTKIIERLGSPTFKKTLLEEIGELAISLIQDEFIRSRDPYGNKWASLVLPRTKGGILKIKQTRGMMISRILYKTGALAKTIRYKIVNEMLHLYSPMKYASSHQKGTRHVPQRMIFPEELIGLPDSWKREIDLLANRSFQRLLINWAFR